ncbi:uncharacterized protein BDV17DRAFT_255362 [Aspergillus undulatus]|uniref:uncharacterized protein n=1 Tax=Aspergillus undulatus TaxID=1810928 RepID=UPI003CCD3D8E
MTESAINRALDTPEVLELVLVQTDMRTLLTSAQRVCRAWFNLIRTSPSIQKALFFTPMNESEVGSEKTLNPLLIEAFPAVFPDKNRSKRYQFSFFDMAITRDAATMNQFLRKDASWRRMLVQQPPVADVGLFHITHAMGGDGARSSSIQADPKMQDSRLSGLCMERLFEVLLFSRDVQFLGYTKTRVYWSIEEPILFDESCRKFNEKFYEMMDKFGLVLYTRKVIQCTWESRTPSPEERTRRRIIAAYKEQGLDVDSKRNDIEESRSETVRY